MGVGVSDVGMLEWVSGVLEWMSKRMPSRRGCPDVGVDVEEENGQMGAWLVVFWDSAVLYMKAGRISNLICK